MTLDSAQADRWTSLVLFALGLAMLIGGYTMDRLEIRQIHPASIPGLVPMILGLAMMLCSTLLFLSAQKAARLEAEHPHQTSSTSHTSLRDLGFAALYSVVYAIVLVGSMPFALATTVYTFVFYTHFTWKSGDTLRRRAQTFAIGIVFAAVSAYAIASLFQHGFLVRLP